MTEQGQRQYIKTKNAKLYTSPNIYIGFRPASVYDWIICMPVCLSAKEVKHKSKKKLKIYSEVFTKITNFFSSFCSGVTYKAMDFGQSVTRRMTSDL